MSMASSQRYIAGSLFGWMAPVLSVDVLPVVDREPNSACLALIRALVSAMALRTLSSSFGIVRDVGSWYRTSSLPVGLVPSIRKLGIEFPVNPGRKLTVSSWLLLSSISRSISWMKIVCWVSSSNIGSVNFCGLCWRVGGPSWLWWLLGLVTDSENDRPTVNDLHLCAINGSTVIYTSYIPMCKRSSLFAKGWSPSGSLSAERFFPWYWILAPSGCAIHHRDSLLWVLQLPIEWPKKVIRAKEEKKRRDSISCYFAIFLETVIRARRRLGLVLWLIYANF